MLFVLPAAKSLITFLGGVWRTSNGGSGTGHGEMFEDDSLNS
jgi:hypothetical protein